MLTYRKTYVQIFAALNEPMLRKNSVLPSELKKDLCLTKHDTTGFSSVVLQSLASKYARVDLDFGTTTYQICQQLFQVQ